MVLKDSQNVYGRWGYLMVLMLLVLALSRWSLYLLNMDTFNSLNTTDLLRAFIKGLRFDLFVLGIIAIPSFFYHLLFVAVFGASRKFERVVNSVSLILVLIAVVLNMSDAIYYRFTLKRMTADIITYLFENDGGLDQLPSFLINFWYITLSVIVLAWALTRFMLGSKKTRKTPFKRHKWWTSTTLFLLTAGILFIALRGGLQLKPINTVDASREVKPVAVPLVLNTPFTIIKTYGKPALTEKHFFSPAQVNNFYNPIKSYNNKVTTSPKNVVIIILESFSLQHIGYFTGEQSFTPFLDSLLTKSLSCAAIANGKRSIEGIPSILSGLPTISAVPFLSSVYATNHIQSIASYLKKYGYSSGFFHGGKNGTMSFDVYASKAGFDAYYGLNEYPNMSDFDGHWGISDEPYFQYFAKEINHFKAPFVASIFSLSSHHPYKVPEKYKDVLPKGKHPIQQCIAYTDMALRAFFTTAKQQDWYKNTLFVITADHTSEGTESKYRNAFWQFRIPLAFYAPGDTNLALQSTHKAVQQTDIFPSIVDYLGYNDSLLAFGSSIFDTTAVPLATNRYGRYLQFWDQDYLWQWQGDTAVAKYNYHNDPLLKNPLPLKQQNAVFQSTCKAFIQQYNNRMIYNKLTP